MAQCLTETAILYPSRTPGDHCKTGYNNVHQYMGTTEVHVEPKCSSDLTFLVPETVASGQELYDELSIIKEGYKDAVDKVGLSINFDDRVDNKQRSLVKWYYIMDGMSKMFPYSYDLGTPESASAIVTIIIRHTALNQNLARKPRKETRADHPAPIEVQEVGESDKLAAMQDAINDQSRPFIPQAVLEEISLSPEGETRVVQVGSPLPPVTESMLKKRRSSEAAVDRDSDDERHSKKFKDTFEEQSVAEALVAVEDKDIAQVEGREQLDGQASLLAMQLENKKAEGLSNGIDLSQLVYSCPQNLQCF